MANRCGPGTATTSLSITATSGVHGTELNALVVELSNERDQVRQRSPKRVETPDDELIASTSIVQRRGQPRSIRLRTRFLVLEGLFAAYLLVSLAIDEMAFGIEMVVDGGMDGCELLKRLHLSKPQHRPFPSSEQQVSNYPDRG
jgi:hypothetical protein